MIVVLMTCGPLIMTAAIHSCDRPPGSIPANFRDFGPHPIAKIRYLKVGGIYR